MLGPRFALVLKLGNLKNLLSVLRTMVTKNDKASITISRTLFTVTVQKSYASQCHVDFPNSFFAEFNFYAGDDLSFGLDLDVFIDCLSILLDKEDKNTPSLKLSVGDDASLFDLEMIESGIVTICRLKPFEIDFVHNLAETFLTRDMVGVIILRVIPWLIQANCVKDALLELDPTSDSITFKFAPSKMSSVPSFSISAGGLSGEAEIAFYRDTEVVSQYSCQQQIEQRFKFQLIHACFKAISLASKVSLRMNECGLSIQCLTSQSNMDVFVEFNFTPLVDD